MTKVVKIFLICRHINEKGNIESADDEYYKEVNHILWDLQKQTRALKNKTIQLCWEWSGFQSDYQKKNGEYPKEKDILNYTLSGYVYDVLKSESDLYTSNCSTTIRATIGEFKNAKKDIVTGNKSILQYKSNQPLDIHNKAVNVSYDGKDYFLKLNLLNRSGVKKYNADTTQFAFKGIVKDNSTRTVLQRCIDGIYKVSASKLIYDRKKKMWCLNLCYSFDNQVNPALDENKILGVDLGVALPIMASVYGDKNRFSIKGGEVEQFRKKTAARQKSMLRQGTVCGNGRIGHGIHTRNKPVYRMEDKVAQFRNTANHKYSRALIDFAVKNGCGTIQMEDLSGVTSNANRFLKNWSYYDLQQKIEYKAKEYGIRIVYIKPKYTSQRCSHCGFICKDNRPEQAAFKCQNCGFEENADYNASQNISIRDIDKIIACELEEINNQKRTEIITVHAEKEKSA